MILFQDVVHLGHVFAGDDLDDVLLVVGGVKACAATALGVARDRRAPRQRVLQSDRRVTDVHTDVRAPESDYRKHRSS